MKTNVVPQYRKSVIGRYEGRFFNEAMDRMRGDYNSANTKVVFIATSDNPWWLQKHLRSKDDIYFPHRVIRQAQPSLKEISMMHAHTELATKGKKTKSFYNRTSLPFKGSISYGVDLAILSQCNHTILDYGTFGLWAALLSGGRIILPENYSNTPTPDNVWWRNANMENVEVIDIRSFNISRNKSVLR